MKIRLGKKGHILLYLLVVIIVLSPLVVLPLADTIHPNISLVATGSAISVVNEATGSSISVVNETTGSAITVTPKVTIFPNKTKYVYKNDDIIVKAVFSEELTLPKNMEIYVKPITKETNKEQYNDVKARVDDSIRANNQIVTNFLAYDIYFMANGIEFEPDLGSVNVSIQYKNELFDKSIKKDSDEIKVLHLKESSKGIQVEDVTGEVHLIDFNQDAIDTTTKTEKVTDKSTDEGIDKTTDEGRNKTTDGGRDKTTDEGTDKTIDEGIVKTTDEGTDKTTDEGIVKTTDEGIDKTTDEGTEEIINEETDKISDKGTHKETDNGLNKGANKGSVVEDDITEGAMVEGTDIGTDNGTDIKSDKEDKEIISKETDKESERDLNNNVIQGQVPKFSGRDTIKFVTKSFSTFVVAGVSKSINTTINVTMKFVDSNGNIDTSVSGKYYLNVTDTYNNRYNLVLNIVNGRTIDAKITGLYDQNGNTKIDGSLHHLTNGNYTAVLFKYPTNCNANFKWDQNYTVISGCVKYELGNEIIENYTITEYSDEVTVKSGVGSMAITATKKAGTHFSNFEILNSLLPVSPYSVFATQFDLIADMEGCIAVQKANLLSNFGNSCNNINNYNCQLVRTITVNKTYHGTTQKTFKFGLFKDNNLCNTTTITLPTSDGGNTAIATFSVSDVTSCYAVYELGDNNEKLAVGDNYNDDTLTSMDTSSKTSLLTFNNTSYVEKILLCVPTAMRQGTTLLKNCLVVGSDYTIKNEHNNVCVYLGYMKLLSAERAYGDITAANGSFPINFDLTLSQMADFSVNLASAISTDTVMVKNMTIAELNSKHNKELNFQTNDRMLLVNIDASGQTNISLAAAAKFIVNGDNCAGWSRQANNIVVNIFTKKGNDYAAYTGNITNAGHMMGTLLVPCASVISLGQNFNGNIVAKYVCNAGGEIHGNTMGSIMIETIYTFINTAVVAIDLPMLGGNGKIIYYCLGTGIIFLAFVLMVIYRIHRKRCYNPSG